MITMVLITQPLHLRLSAQDLFTTSRDKINTFYVLHMNTGLGDFQILFQSIDHMIGPTAK